MDKKRLSGEGSILFNNAKGIWISVISDNGRRISRHSKTRSSNPFL